VAEQVPPDPDAAETSVDAASTTASAAASASAGGILSAALLIGLGNIASRILGLVRESTIAFYFGRGLAAESFAGAWTLIVTVYDLLINGAISAALVPVFSEYAEGDATEFWRIVSGVVNMALLALGVVVGLFAWQAPFVVSLLIDPTRTDLIPQIIALVRLLLPAVLFMGLSACSPRCSLRGACFCCPRLPGRCLTWA
jgi:putative peptidoglycan lipid II flippase